MKEFKVFWIEEISKKAIIKANSLKELEDNFYENVPEGKFHDCYKVEILTIKEIGESVK